jgi:hypothetical protein
MKKRVFLLPLTLICWISAISQNDAKPYWGINLSSGIHTAIIEHYNKENPQSSTVRSLDFAQENYLLTPSISYGFDRHLIHLGPRIFLPENHYNRFGTQLTYDYRLNKTKKKFNLSLSCDLIYTYEKMEKERNLTIGNSIYTSDWTTQSNQLNTLVLFGFRTFIIEKLYLDLRAGVGIGLRSHKSTDHVSELPEYNTLNTSSQLFENPELNNKIKIGIGYNF